MRCHKLFLADAKENGSAFEEIERYDVVN